MFSVLTASVIQLLIHTLYGLTLISVGRHKIYYHVDGATSGPRPRGDAAARKIIGRKKVGPRDDNTCVTRYVCLTFRRERCDVSDTVRGGG